ncbi:hypothetical protein Zmor_013563 [Zophobas morio]|uniref:Uncharacterized protein n=1 Tax=Zophobas morio TaxID=2755281 RepID=A0AA38IHN6_9CUCU|nr:hypothetical protein Zmor_013563 [Zophobas morio]
MERALGRTTSLVGNIKSFSSKALWAHWDSLCVENELLKRAWESPNGKHTTMQLVVPASGHPNQRCTSRYAQWRVWYSFSAFVAEKTSRARVRNVQQYNIGSPFETIAVNIADPFPVTEDGNT